MTDTDRIELSIPSHPRYLQMVRAMVKKVTRIHHLPCDQAEGIVLAVDEACSNVIKHAYANSPNGRLEFLIEVRDSRLDISITDYGTACDLRRMKPRDLDDVRPGGLGVYIINEVMDKVVYTCGEKGRNSIQMTKRIHPPK